MPDKAQIPVIVLAAGQSSRMRGRDKLLELVGSEPLLRRQAQIARAATTGPVIVALPPPPHARYALLDGLDVTPLPVPQAAEGMGASLRTAIAALPPDAPAAMLVLADLPELEATDLARVLAAVGETPDALVWRGMTDDKKPGHPLVFAAELFPALMAPQGDTGGRETVAAAGKRVVHVPLPGQRARADLDTPEDWAAWRAARG